MRRIQTALVVLFVLCTPLVLTFAALPALAQDKASGQPLPAIPPPPPEMAPLDASFEPEVTIKKREGDTIEEHRINGKLFKIKVTPAHGVPYYLIDRNGDGNFTQTTMGSADVSVPQWVIGTF
ncbi:DUF2782 domain-containing protein [Accumulibacter sp.]|uniref:DUF2782 domain-containing protein n=1 Tax=Accumulibacter sp. TaxID=2053492 RepID=UPI0035AE776C